MQEWGIKPLETGFHVPSDTSYFHASSRVLLLDKCEHLLEVCSQLVEKRLATMSYPSMIRERF